MITIDGAFGEGGGQIIRTSLALSLVTGKPFSMDNIRAKRKKPGLLRQHLTAVNAARAVGSAEVQGNQLGSRCITFLPGVVKGGSYRFVIESAGSCTLVLQTVLPALMIAPEPSCVIIEGGTHNPFAPPFDFLETAFVPLVNRMGPRIAVVLERPGFYPEGGGRMCATIEPSRALSALDLTDRGALVRRSAQALVSQLPKSIADRELRVVRKALQVRRDACDAVELTNAAGPGNVLFITIDHERVTEVFTGFGQRGLPAEAVANRAARAAREYLSSGAAVGANLADQLLIPLALAGGGQFTTLAPSEHMTTNIAVIKKFLDVPMDLQQIDAVQWRLCLGEPAA